jgi:two-component system chemotaxis response regulator CheB
MTETIPENDERALRVLVVDDSAYNRQTITAMLETNPNVEVVGRATNGKEALKLAFDLEPDVITLDLEMPEMDGFSFLRLLMARKPIPVLVISGYSQRDNVFRALELGAMDFIAKPRRHISPDIRNIDEELAGKIEMVRRLQAVRLKQRADSLAAQRARRRTDKPELDGPLYGEAPRAVVVIGASTGGPPAIQQLLAALPPDLAAAIIVAQHMPARFTKAYAQRLDRVLDLRVVEVVEDQPVCAGVVHIVPGSHNVEVDPRGDASGGNFRIVEPQKGRLTPSVDLLFETVARAYRSRVCAVLLTGMGSDGTAGARRVRELGGIVAVEDPATAVMPGMPFSAVEAGAVDHVASVEDLPAFIASFVERHREGPRGPWTPEGGGS